MSRASGVGHHAGGPRDVFTGLAQRPRASIGHVARPPPTSGRDMCGGRLTTHGANLAFFPMPIVLSPEDIRKTVPGYSDQISFQADLSHGGNVTVSRKGPKDAFFQPLAVAKFVGGSLEARSGALVNDAEVSGEIWALLAAQLRGTR